VRLARPHRATLFPYTTLFRSVDHGRKFGGQLGPQRLDQGGGLVYVFREDRGQVGTLEGCPAGERVEEGRAQGVQVAARVHRLARSEEHTSELQSLAYLVCRLL